MSKRRSIMLDHPLSVAVVGGVLAAITAAILAVTSPNTNNNGGQQSSTSSPPFHFTPSEIIAVAVVIGFVAFAISIAAAFYWRAKIQNSLLAQETERRQRDEVEKILERLQNRMSLPGLIELNRLMLTEYHSIATNQAQKSFRSAQRAMLGGFSWLIVCFTAVILVSSLNGKILAAALAPVGGVLAGFLGRTYLFVYERSLVQLNQYYNQPLLNSYYLAAERLATEMSASAKDRLLEKVIDQLLAAASSLSEGSAQNSVVSRKRVARASKIRPAPGSEDGQASTVIAGSAG